MRYYDKECSKTQDPWLSPFALLVGVPSPSCSQHSARARAGLQGLEHDVVDELAGALDLGKHGERAK